MLATVVRCEPPTSAHPGDAAVVTADGGLTGWIGGSCAEPLVRREALRALADGMPRLVRIVPAEEVSETRTPGELVMATTCPSGGALDVFIDPQIPAPLLVVAGGSPAARALVQMGAVTGFRVVAVHPGGQAADFPGAGAVLPALDGVATLNPGPDTWCVVASMGHYDEEALESLLRSTPPEVEVGLVASVRRAASVLGALRARGVDESALGRVHAPAGALRSGSQEEIALLALAEVVTRRRARLGDRRGSAPPVATVEAAAFAVDPVCGMTVDVAESRVSALRAGETVHFCCEGCRDRFLAEPDRFASVGPAAGAQ